jgi:hypothetical protein
MYEREKKVKRKIEVRRCDEEWRHSVKKEEEQSTYTVSSSSYLLLHLLLPSSSSLCFFVDQRFKGGMLLSLMRESEREGPRDGFLVTVLNISHQPTTSNTYILN